MRVIDVAKHILGKVGPKAEKKLNLLCYYAQAWTLALDGKPLFENDFEAQEDGPVCLESNQFRLPVDFSADALQKIPLTTSSPREREIIDGVLAVYSEYSLPKLRNLAKSENPWRNARERTAPNSARAEIISKDDMFQYYSKLAQEGADLL